MAAVVGVDAPTGDHRRVVGEGLGQLAHRARVERAGAPTDEAVQGRRLLPAREADRAAADGVEADDHDFGRLPRSNAVRDLDRQVLGPVAADKHGLCAHRHRQHDSRQRQCKGNRESAHAPQAT